MPVRTWMRPRPRPSLAWSSRNGCGGCKGCGCTPRACMLANHNATGDFLELVKRVFPQLRRLCEQRAVTWTEVDLRWGIPEERKAEGKILPLCLAQE